MSDKTFHFLSGLPRSGSTLLGSILNQNPMMHVSPTSPVCDLFNMFEADLRRCSLQYDFNLDQVTHNVSSEFLNIFYKHIDAPVVVDKHRAWARNLRGIKATLTPTPKVICTHRPISEIIVSFIKLAKNDPNNNVDDRLRQNRIELNTRNRAMSLWKDYVKDTYTSLKIGLETDRSCIHLVGYNELINNNAQTLKGVYDFLGIDAFDHTTDDIVNTCAESKDDSWGFKHLHDIRPKLEKTSDDPLEVLGPELFEYFNEFDKQLGL